MIATHSIRILALLSVLVIVACESTSPSSSPKIDFATASPRDFLFNQSAGTKYMYLNTSVLIDSNGVEASRTSQTIELRQLAAVVRDGDKSVSRYVAAEEKTLVANDTSLWLSDASVQKVNQVFLRKPFVPGSVFSSEWVMPYVNDTRIIDTSGSVTISEKSYQTIAVVYETDETWGSSRYVKSDSMWFGVGIGMVKQAIVATTIYASGKSAKVLTNIEMNSIIK